MALAEAVGPNCGVCLDVFHMNIEEKDMHAALRASKSRLVDVHVAENNRLAPGMGSVDWKAFVETLKDIGYDGALTMEAVAPIDRTPGLALDEPVEQNPVDISPEQLKFIGTTARACSPRSTTRCSTRRPPRRSCRSSADRSAMDADAHIHYVNVNVDDLETAVPFYRDVLELASTRRPSRAWPRSSSASTTASRST